MSAETRILLTPAPAPDGLPTSGAGAGTLAHCIALFHQRNPDFVAVLPCVEPMSSDPDAQQRRWASEARRLRIPLDEYMEHVYADQRYCLAHRDWHFRSAFSSAPSEAGRVACKAYRNERQRALYRQRKGTAR